MNRLAEELNETMENRRAYTEKELIHTVLKDLNRGDEVVLRMRNALKDTVEENHFVCLGDKIEGLTALTPNSKGFTKGGASHPLMYKDQVDDVCINRGRFTEKDCQSLERHESVNYLEMMDAKPKINSPFLHEILEDALDKGKVGPRTGIDKAWTFEADQQRGIRKYKKKTEIEQELDDTRFLCKQSKNEDRARAVYTIRYAAQSLSWGNAKEARLAEGCHKIANRLARGDSIEDAVLAAQKDVPEMAALLTRVGRKAKDIYPDLDKGFEQKLSKGKILAMRSGSALSVLKSTVKKGIRRLHSKKQMER